MPPTIPPVHSHAGGTLAALWDASALIGEFRDEAREQLGALDAALATLEERGSLTEEERKTLLRGLHTLKGNGGMLGLAAIQDYVHALEDRFRAPPPEWSRPVLDQLFAGAGALRHAVEDATTEREAAAFARLAELHPSAEGEPPAPAPELPAAAAEGEPAEVAPAPAAETIRVRWAELDVLLNRVGDVLGVASALAGLEASHRTALAAAGVRRPLLAEVERLERVAGELRRSATGLRLVPISAVFERFPPLVRELAQEQGKRVRLELAGGDTELDKGTVDAIGEPLLHLIRNAVDHGAGAPGERLAAGKAEQNTLLLAASQSGDRVRITLEDDGPGLDRDAILARAREAGLLRPGEEAEPEELIFQPGFSTRREASTVSGRGMGLDIVRTAVRRLRGTLEVEDVPEGGTRFVLLLPLTVALVPALLLEAAGATFALPTADVEATLRRGEVQNIAAAEVVRFRGETVPLAYPGRLFGWEANGSPGALLVIVRRGRRAAALVADRVLEQRDALVKALPPWLGAVPGISGATLAPDGTVVLLLDTAGILNLNLEAHRRTLRAG